MSKPREWFLQFNNSQTGSFGSRNFFNDPYGIKEETAIHVIERSYATDLEQQLDELKDKLERTENSGQNAFNHWQLVLENFESEKKKSKDLFEALKLANSAPITDSYIYRILSKAIKAYESDENLTIVNCDKYGFDPTKDSNEEITKMLKLLKEELHRLRDVAREALEKLRIELERK